jgi:hypothetical protein
VPSWQQAGSALTAARHTTLCRSRISKDSASAMQDAETFTARTVGRLNRRALVLGLTVALVGVLSTAGVVLAFRDGGSAVLSRSEYLRRANAICDSYGKRLDRVPPPLDPASPGAVYESIGLALPLLREQSTKVRTLAPPRAMRANVDRFFALTDRSLRDLERARRHAGERALFPMVQAISAFERSRNAAKRVSRSIGFRC